MHADDSTLYGSEEDFVSFKLDVNAFIGILIIWFKINKLSHNPKTTRLTKYMEKIHTVIPFNKLI